MNAPAAAPLRLRILRSAVSRLHDVRGSAALNPAVLRDGWASRAGGYPVDEAHRPHLLAALDWLVAAQDATPDDGFARGYSLAWSPYFGGRGWQPSYPETTGYIIPTLYSVAEILDRPDLAERATRAARWEAAVQMPSGAVQGGVIGERPSPAVFNTGQVVFGWLAAWQHTGDEAFAEAARRAGRFLVDALDADGHWRRGNSRYARGDATAYNARAAWALAEAGVRLREPRFVDAAARALRAVAAAQHDDGWFPGCCLYDPERPLLHTLAYAMRGVLEGGRVLGDAELLRHGALAAEHTAAAVREDGWIAGQLRAGWSPGCAWSCLTGEAQLANNLMRLHQVTGEARWLAAVPRLLRFLKATQNRASSDPGIRGGIRGSAPVGGEYGRYEVLNWATKFFADALMRHEEILARGSAARVSPLA